MPEVADDADDRAPWRAGTWIPDFDRLPTGSAFGQSRRAIVWLTTTTGGLFGPSSSVKDRPRRIGMPIARK